MKNHIHQVRLKPRSQEWLDWRYKNGLGGSDIGATCAVKSHIISELTYTAPIKQFLQLIGEPVQAFTGNLASESGIFFEPIIVGWLKYIDLETADQHEMFRNIRENKRINKCLSPKVFIVNDKYPNIFFSPDCWIWPKFGTQKFLVETKHTSSMETRRFERRISPLFFLQVQCGLMVTELPAAHLAVLVDGRYLDLVKIEPHLPTWELIQECAEYMWSRVTKARQLKAEYGIQSYFGVNPDYFSDKQKEGVELISQLEPELIGTDSELDFIKAMIKPSEDDNPMQGTEDQKALCQKYNSFGDSISEIEVEKKRTYIQLIESLNGANRADFNDGTFFSYKSNVKGARILHVSPRILPLTP